MVGKTWSQDEERFFWHVIIPRSPKSVNPAGRISDWEECAKIMRQEMGEKPRRNYTKLMLFEHYFQNVHTGHKSPNAGKFVNAHKRELAGKERRVTPPSSISTDSEGTSTSSASKSTLPSSQSSVVQLVEAPAINNSNIWSQHQPETATEDTALTPSIHQAGSQDTVLASIHRAGRSLKRKAEPSASETLAPAKMPRFNMPHATVPHYDYRYFGAYEGFASHGMFPMGHDQARMPGPGPYAADNNYTTSSSPTTFPLDNAYSQPTYTAVPQPVIAFAAQEREAESRQEEPAPQGEPEQDVATY